MSLSLCTWSSGHPSPEGGGEEPEEIRAPSVGEKADGQPDQGLQDTVVRDKAAGEHLLITSCSRRAGGQMCSLHEPLSAGDLGVRLTLHYHIYTKA